MRLLHRKFIYIFKFPERLNFETQITLDYSFHYGNTRTSYIQPTKPVPVKVPEFRIAPPNPRPTTPTEPPTTQEISTTTTEASTTTTEAQPQTPRTPDPNSFTPELNFECGIVENEITTSTPLIIGGRDVNRGQFPW